MRVYKLASFPLIVSCFYSLLSGCSSSSSSDVSINGAIVAAAVNGAQVSLVDDNGNVVAGPVSTDTTGQYTMTLPMGSLAQNLIVKSTGGTFKDEATGNTTAAGEMLTYISANTLGDGDNVCATPGSTIIAQLVMQHNKTMTQAENAFSNAFGYTPDKSVVPANAMSPAASSDNKEKLAGFRAAAFSQLALDLGLSHDNQFDMFSALAQDLSDDVLDGIDASGAVDIGTTGLRLEADIRSRFSAALINFYANSNNGTGLDNSQIGNIPFAKTVLTNTYKIEYIQPSIMSTMEGRSTFQLHITHRNTGADVTGLTPVLVPMMHMATMTHSTPLPAIAVTEDANGLYTVDIYYLMASQMMDGTSMGYWDLQFTVGGEEAHFYPAVVMSMGDTVRTRLKGQTDVIKDMEGNDVGRDYFIFKEGLTGTGPYTFTLFIAARESMMSFPALVNNTQLMSGMGGTPLDITSIDVDVLINGGSVTVNSNGDGSWNADLTLTDDVANQVEVKLSVNGERKTSDGTSGGLNSTFIITPGSM